MMLKTFLKIFDGNCCITYEHDGISDTERLNAGWDEGDPLYMDEEDYLDTYLRIIGSWGKLKIKKIDLDSIAEELNILVRDK